MYLGNMLMEKTLKDDDRMELKVEILNSNLIRLWDWMNEKECEWHNYLNLMLQVSFDPFPKDEELCNGKMIGIVRHLTTYIGMNEESDLLIALTCLRNISYHYSATVALMTKSIWERLIHLH